MADCGGTEVRPDAYDKTTRVNTSPPTDILIDASLISRMKALDEENKRLKKMYVEKSIQNDLLTEALGKEW